MTPPVTTLTHDMWRFHILFLCDPISMIRLSWTCRELRWIMNDPTFVVQWQEHCRYIDRQCKCNRNMFYLVPDMILDFTYDWNIEISSEYEVDRHLVSIGRSVPMLVMHQQIQWQKLPYLDPPSDKTNFIPGTYQACMENLIIPMPRMLPLPVDRAVTRGREHPRSVYQQRMEFETDDAYRFRMFWRNFHQFPAPHDMKNAPDFLDINVPIVDYVDLYIQECMEAGEDPYDPAQDPELKGHSAGQWARKVMYNTGVGIQKYPLDLCIRYDQIQTASAQHHGVDYLERLFLQLRDYSGDGALLQHAGSVYFSPVRYDNERGDFVNWALSTVAVVSGFYNHAWFDCCFQFLHTLTIHVLGVATSIEEDLYIERMACRWKYLEHLNSCAACQSPAHQHRNENEQKRDEDGIRMMHRSNYNVYNNLVYNSVKRYMENPSDDSEWNRNYLVPLIPQYDHHQHLRYHRTEEYIVRYIENLLDVLSYVTDFANSMAPRVNPVTQMYRTRTLKIYLMNGMSLMTFAPSWHMTYDWKPSRTGLKSSLRLPHLDLMQNHRVSKYLHFLNRRVLFYHPDPVLHATAWQQDVGRFNHSA